MVMVPRYFPQDRGEDVVLRLGIDCRRPSTPKTVHGFETHRAYTVRCRHSDGPGIVLPVRGYQLT